MHSFLSFLGTVILLLTMVNHAHADAVREDAEGLRTEVVLEASEIDSRTVEVGALAVVVYGQGERHPTSGEWATLDTARGYIKAVDPRRLIVGLEPDGGSKWIALTRIQTLRLIGSSSLGAADRNSTQVDSGRTASGFQAMPDILSVKTGRGDDREAGIRIAKKLGAGALWGSTFGLFSGTLMAGSVIRPGVDGIGQEVVFYFFGWLGYTVGTAVGVSRVDPHDRFISSLMGSLLGNVSGIVLAPITGSPNALLVCPVASVALAVWLSEGSRNRLAERTSKPLEVSRFSIDLGPSLGGHFLAVAKLRF